MADRIKGITVVLGGDTTGLNKALAGTNKEIKDTQAQLKDVERLLKLDPTNTVLLEQKQRLLGQAVEETKKKLDTLNKANEQVVESRKNYDAWKKVFDPIQEEIDQTSQKLKDLKKRQKEIKDIGEIDTDAYKDLQIEIEETGKQLSGLKKQAKEVSNEFGNPVGQDQYDALQREIEATSQQLKELETQAQKSNSTISGITVAIDDISTAAGSVRSAFAPVTAGIVGLAGAAVATVPATEELRNDLSKLDANAQENAVSVDAAREAWRQFAVQSGETDSAVEATANLLQAGFTESNLQKAVEGLAGAAQRFPDTLKIEGLADSLQETLATGSATGQFGELLDRLGIGAENFSEQLANCTTDAETQNLALQTLAEAGLNDSYNAWKQNNEEMLANQEANLKLQESMAQLAEVVLPIVTMVADKAAELVSWFANLDTGAQTLIAVIGGVVAAISPIAGVIQGATTVVSFMTTTAFPALSAAMGTITTNVLPALGNAFSSIFSFIAANPIVLLIGAIVALVALIATKGDEIQALLQKLDDFLQNIFVKDWTQVFGPVLGNVLNGFFKIVEDIWNSVKRIFDGIIDFIRGVFTGDWERAWKGVSNIFGGIFDGLIAIAKAPLNGLIGLLNGAIGAINSLINGFNSIGFTLPKWLGGGSWNPNLPNIPTIPYLAKGGTVLSGSAVVGEAGPELLTVGPTGTRVQPLTGGTSSVNTTNLGGISMTVYGAPGQSVTELADLIMDRIQTATTQKEAIFGA